MTRILRNSFITIASITTLVGITLFSQGASAATNKCAFSTRTETTKCCARVGVLDVSGCREATVCIKKRQCYVTFALLKIKDDESGGEAKGGRSGRGQK